MQLPEVIQKYQEIVIQIATPYSTGTGFYFAEDGIIVTNEHVVRDNRVVVVEGKKMAKQLVEVIFIDEKHDLAFLACPTPIEVEPIILDIQAKLEQGDVVLAIGHPYGFPFAATQGILSNLLYENDGVQYYQHDASLNPGNSGGPLVNDQGNLIGINTFIIKDGNNIGFSLPVKYLQEALEEFRKGGGESGVRCRSCLNIVFENTVQDKYCNFCGAGITMISRLEVYEPVGISKTIEEMLDLLGYSVELARRGPNNWEISKGSANISISYHEKSGLIIADAYLCLLPEKDIKPLYEFLLKENYKNDSLTFSVKNQDVIISILIYDQYLNSQTASELFQQLFIAADKYDDLLVQKFNARWKDDNQVLRSGK